MKKRMMISHINAEQFTLSSVGVALAIALEKSDISKRQLAKSLNISEVRITKILAANYNPTIKTLARIANALGCELKIVMRNWEKSSRKNLSCYATGKGKN